MYDVYEASFGLLFVLCNWDEHNPGDDDLHPPPKCATRCRLVIFTAVSSSRQRHHTSKAGVIVRERWRCFGRWKWIGDVMMELDLVLECYEFGWVLWSKSTVGPMPSNCEENHHAGMGWEFWNKWPFSFRRCLVMTFLQDPQWFEKTCCYGNEFCVWTTCFRGPGMVQVWLPVLDKI